MIEVAAVAAVAVVALGARCWGSLRPTRISMHSQPHHVRRLLSWRRRATHAARVTDVAAAAWCDDAARLIRSGSSLASAIDEATSTHRALAGALSPTIAALGRGRSLADGLANTVAAGGADPSTPTGLVIATLRSCAELGGPAAAPLERVAATLRTRAAIRDEQAAQSAQARLSAKVLTLVPVALLALLSLTEANIRGALVTPAGIAVVSAGAALNAAGWLWMQRIIERAT